MKSKILNIKKRKNKGQRLLKDKTSEGIKLKNRKFEKIK